METMCVPSKTLWPTLTGCKWGRYLFFLRKRLALRVLPRQQQRRCHSVSSVMYIAGAKFEEHCFNISRVILDLMSCCFRGVTYDIIAFLIRIIRKRKNLQNKKKICHKGKRQSSLLCKAFQTGSNYFFYFTGTLMCHASL